MTEEVKDKRKDHKCWCGDKFQTGQELETHFYKVHDSEETRGLYDPDYPVNKEEQEDDC